MCSHVCPGVASAAASLGPVQRMMDSVRAPVASTLETAASSFIALLPLAEGAAFESLFQSNAPFPRNESPSRRSRDYAVLIKLYGVCVCRLRLAVFGISLYECVLVLQWG